MALALTREYTDLEEVADACLTAYRGTGQVADLMTWNRLFLGEYIREAQPTPTVVARSSRTIECVLPHDTDPADYIPGLRRMMSEDWDVTLLVHSSRMGKAHHALRGTMVTIQPWWHEGGEVHFGQPEIP